MDRNLLCKNIEFIYVGSDRSQIFVDSTDHLESRETMSTLSKVSRYRPSGETMLTLKKAIAETNYLDSPCCKL